LKKHFAPLPARAIGDVNLSALDLRVLAAVAFHDRFSSNGIGCSIGHSRLAMELQCHTKSLSRSLSDLMGCGYINEKPHPLNRRVKVYSIVYSELDGGASVDERANAIFKNGLNWGFTAKAIAEAHHQP
jgi:hypothetical protein